MRDTMRPGARVLVLTTLVLIGSNVFMTLAWYGHLRWFDHRPWFVAVVGAVFFAFRGGLGA